MGKEDERRGSDNKEDCQDSQKVELYFCLDIVKYNFFRPNALQVAECRCDSVVVDLAFLFVAVVISRERCRRS